MKTHVEKTCYNCKYKHLLETEWYVSQMTNYQIILTEETLQVI